MKAKEKIPPAFLTGGGKMGEFIRSFDWSKTAIGCPDTWPQSLCIAVNIMLDSPFGMYIAWGNEYIQLYNDGYCPFLGATKHPHALGSSTRKTFAEVWPTIGPMFDGVMKGIPVSFSNLTFQLERHGFLEECVFDFSYSPIRLQDGEVGGVLVTVMETTKKVKSVNVLKESEQELQYAIEATELVTWDLNPATNKFRGNSRLKEWFGLQANEEIELPVALAVIANDERDKVISAIQTALQPASGGHYDIIYTIIHPKTQYERIVRAKGRASFNEEGIAYRFNGTLQDVTEEIVARRLLTQSEQHLRNERMVLYNSFMNAPAGIAIMHGNTHIYEFANTEYEKLVDRKTPPGKTVQELFPEVEQQGLIDILNLVFSSGVPFIANEFPVELINKETGKLVLGYYNLVVQPMKDENGKTERLLSHAVEVTQQFEARKQIEEANQQLRFAAILTENIADAVVSTDMDYKIISWNKGAENLYGYTSDEVMGKFPLELLRTQFLSDEDKYAWQRDFNSIGKWQGEVVQTKKDGSMVSILVSIANVYDEKGKPVAGVAVNRNITERKKAEEELAASEAKFKMLSETIPHMVWTATPDGKKNFFNKYFLDYTGLSFEELKDDGWKVVIFTEDLENELALWHKSLRTGEDYRIEKRIRYHDGTYQWHLCHSIAQKDKNGNVIGWIGTNTGIEGQKKIAEELEQKVKERTYQLHIQNETFKQAEESSMQGSYSFNLTTGKLTYSDNLYRLIGYEPNEFEPSLEEFNKHVYPEDSDYVTQAAEKVLTSKTADEWHYRMNTKNGQVINIKGTGRVIESGDEKLLVGTLQDVTNIVLKQKEVETVNEQLQLQNQTFELAESIAKFGSYKWNITTGALEYSDNLFRLLDCEPDEFVPSFEKFLSFIHPDDLQQVVSNGEQTMITGELVETPYRIISKKGTIKYFRSSGNFLDEGVKRLLIGTVQDISKDVAVADALVEKENYLNQIISNAPDGVIVIDENSIISLWNPKTEEIFGWKAAEVVGLHLTDTIVPTQHRQAHRDGMQRLLETGEARILNKTLELTALNKNGKEFPISITISQAMQQGKKLFIAFLRDITFEKRTIELATSNRSLIKANSELEAAQKLSEKLLKQRDEFISIASHEMKTPLTTAKGYIELLLLTLSEENQTTLYATKANQAVERLHNLVSELLDASKIQNGQLNYTITTFDFNKMVNETIEDIQYSSKTHNIQKTGSCSQQITGDRGRLQQVLINLLSNAIKYSPNADKVSVKIEELDGEIQVSVQDFGVGMSNEHLNKIFDRYYRVPEHAIHFQGLGIGLYISYNIIERHNGTMFAKSEREKGSIFYFTLPV